MQGRIYILLRISSQKVCHWRGAFAKRKYYTEISVERLHLYPLLDVHNYIEDFAFWCELIDCAQREMSSGLKRKVYSIQYYGTVCCTCNNSWCVKIIVKYLIGEKNRYYTCTFM